MSHILNFLPRCEKRRLLKSIRKEKDALQRQRYQIVWQYAVLGHTTHRIAQNLGCVPSTVVRWLQRYWDEGLEGLVDRRRDNGLAKVDDDLLGALIVLLGNSPQEYGWSRTTWTRELLVLGLELLTGVRISISTLARMLKKLEARWKTARPILRCPWPKNVRNKRLKEIQKVVKNLPKNEVVLYEDEVDIHLNPRIGRDWMLKGIQKEIVTPGKNKKRYIAGALNHRNGEIHWVSGERKNSDLFIKLLRALCELYPHVKRIHLILDNYITHSSKKVLKAIEKDFEGRIVLHFLPPYSPEHNRIEHLWKELHANITRNHRCRTIDALMKNVESFLKRASPFPGSKPSLARKRLQKIKRHVIRKAG